MNYFETKFVKLLNDYFLKNNLNAIAYRSKQAKFSKQFYDIIVDSKIFDFYMAIECKNLESNDLYFSTHFRKTQVENLSFFQNKTGRNCFLAIKQKKTISLIPWPKIIEIYQSEKKIKSEIINTYCINLKNANWLSEYLSILNYNISKWQ